MKLILHFVSYFLVMPGVHAQMVKYSGAMSKIRQEKKVDAAILVDTINAENLYAVGPVENLRGEILVWDNVAFVAAINEEKKPYLRKDVKNLKAIFLVYADVKEWDTLLIEKKQVRSIAELESAIAYSASRYGLDTSSAFPFQVFARAKQGSGHIMYKDLSVILITPEDLQKAAYVNTFTDQYIQMLGFYSQHHQTIFTHHDSYLHIHYRLRNKYQAGHLEEIYLDPEQELKILFPKQKSQVQ
jgi:acetolactate decarboxylase